MSGNTIVRQRGLHCGECGCRVLVQAEGPLTGGEPHLLPTAMPASCQKKGECQEEFELGMLDAEWWATARETNKESA